LHARQIAGKAGPDGQYVKGKEGSESEREKREGKRREDGAHLTIMQFLNKTIQPKN